MTTLPAYFQQAAVREFGFSPVNKQKPYYISLDPFILWNREKRPFDWNDYFKYKAPVELEIGFGNGEALIRRAAENRNINYVGLELAWESIKRALRRIAIGGIENVKIMQVDAQLALERLFTENSLQGACSLFPVPWPKERHINRRIFSKEFLTILNNRLAADGKLQIVSDSRPLMDWVLEQVEDTGFRAEWNTTPAIYRTKYERKWQGNGQSEFYEIILHKEQHMQAPITEDIPLIAFNLDHFEPENFNPVSEQGLITVKFREFMYDPKRKKALLRAIVAEGRLLQDIWLKIAAEGDGWHLGLAQNTNVVPSAGIKRALELARDAALGVNIN